MEIGIIGLPKSGKTTLFHALTKKGGETKTAMNIGVAKVPDPRLQRLEEIFKPKRTIPVEVRYVDAAPKGFTRDGVVASELSPADALIQVIRAFEDDRVPHPEGSIDPERGLSTLNLELAFSDLAIIEHRLGRIEVALKGARQEERELIHREKALLERIKDELEHDTPLREQTLSEEEMRIIESYQFLTAKPQLIVLNIGEDRLGDADSLEEEWRARYSRPRLEVAVLSAEIEEELAELSEEDAGEFRSAMGLGGTGSERIIRLSYSLLGLISFFTVVSQEVKAWTIHKGTTAPRAAGKVHSDMERGFIRAEVIQFDDLVKCGSIAEGRKRGLLRSEGKNYTVQDGDIITFLFNI